MRRAAAVIIVLTLLLGAREALAHANLEEANPPANAHLMQPPDEIRLRFSEPLEADFSGITLLDANGERVDTATAILDPTDAHQLVLRPGDLPDGLYTVSWRALSSADGHATQGNYAFTLGVGAYGETASTAVETIPDFSVPIRWLNFAGMSLAVGSIGFWLFVWTPSGFGAQLDTEKRMSRLIWFGWVLLGVAGIAMLLLQLSVATGKPLLQVPSFAALENFLNSTRYGMLWWGRMTLWFAMGNALVFASDNRRILWIALALGIGILLTNSLFSHASTAPDQTAAVAGDWLHLTMTALWVGGLLQFLNVIGLTGRATSAEVSESSILVVHFSNYARVAVAGLVITGLYAAWLQVGTLEALATTRYGQALVIKLILFAPLLMIAGINLVYTHRGLRAGDIEWSQRLRGLVGAEIMLLLGMLVAVGVMTSVNPARAVAAVRDAVPTNAANPYFQMEVMDDVMVHLHITPGTVGTNTFTLDLYTHEGDHVTDASSVRLRFLSQDTYLGESALVLEAQPDGTYQAVGDNLSLPGAWRVRANVQRPGEFDTVTDFEPEIAAPAPPPVQVNPAPSLSQRTMALLATGLLALVIGGFFAGSSRAPLWRGMGLLATSVILVGMVFLVSGVMVG